MTAAEIVAAMLNAYEILRMVDRFASICVSGRPESLVLAVAVAAGVEPTIYFYPGEPDMVIVSAPVGGAVVTFAAVSRPATAEEIADHATGLQRHSEASF